MTTGQRRTLFSKLKDLGLEGQRKSLTFSFTDGRSESFTDMLIPEANALITHLQRLQNDRKKPAQKPSEVPARVERERCNEMRKKVFSLCRSMGYIYGFSPEDQKINQAVVYGLVTRRGYLKPKPLNQYTFAELPKLVSQFEHMQTNNDKTKARKEAQSLRNELGI